MSQPVCIIYNEPLAGTYAQAGEAAAVSGVLDAVRAVQSVLSAQGLAVELQPLRPPLARAARQLRRIKAGVVFNLFEGFDDEPASEGEVAALLESAGHCVTGAPAKALRDCQQKNAVKARLRALGIATPNWTVAAAGPLPAWQDYPCIVKPCGTHASHVVGLGAAGADRIIFARAGVQCSGDGPAAAHLPHRRNLL